MRAKTVQRVRGGRLLKRVNDEPFFYPPIANESVLRKKHIKYTTNHRKPRSKQKYARYKLTETGERRRPGAFCCDHFYTSFAARCFCRCFSLFFVVPSSFTSCDDDWRRFLMKKRRHGFLFVSFLLALSLSDIKD